MASQMIDEKPVADPKSESSKNLLSDLYMGTAEETYARSSVVPESQRNPYNPDDLWQKTGDYSIYEDMTKDDQVSVCLQLKKDLVLGSGYDFTPGEEGQEEIIDDLEKAFNEDPDVPIEDSLEEIITAYEFGFSLSEKIFKTRDDGTLSIRAIKTRYPNSWLIHTDDQGNIEKYIQRAKKGDIDVKPKSLVHYVNARKFQNPYGTSDLRVAYAAWFAKRQCIRFLAIFLEKAASPTPVARYDRNAPQTAVDAIFAIIKKFQTKTAIAIPKDIELEFLEAKSTGEAYHKAINLFNMFIGRSLFIPDLVGFQGGETAGGAFALGKEHMGLFFRHINRRRAALERIVNREFVAPIVMFNHGLIEKMPKFKFKPISEEAAVELAKTWLEGVKGKVYKPSPDEINHFRKLVKFPETDPEDIEIPESASPNPLGATDGDGEGAGTQAPKAMDGQLSQGKKEGYDNPKDESKEEKKSFGYELPKGDYHKKVDFKAINTKFDDYLDGIRNETKPIVKKILNDVYDQIERKKILQNQNVERIETIDLKYLKELKQALKGNFRELYKDAQNQAVSELEKGSKKTFKTSVPSEKFLDVLEAETFQYVGDWSYMIKKKVRMELVSAIKDGKTLASVIDVLDVDGNQLSEVSLERFARTKHTEVLNNGRLAFFEESGVVAAYQYSAILDDRTSDVCAGLHGKVFKSGSEPVPPMHFNCRSVLVPITKYEEFEPSKTVGDSPIQEFIDENKGDGFSKNTSEQKPKITDKDVDIDTVINGLTEIIVYSKNSIPFHRVTVTYSEDRKQVMRLKNEPL